MRKSDAIAYYGTQQKLGEAVGRAQNTVAGWGEVVPIGFACLLEKGTSRRLKVDVSLYPDLPPVLRARVQ